MKKQHDYVDYNHNNQQTLMKTWTKKFETQKFLGLFGQIQGHLFLKRGFAYENMTEGKINQSAIIQAV